MRLVALVCNRDRLVDSRRAVARLVPAWSNHTRRFHLGYRRVAEGDLIAGGWCRVRADAGGVAVFVLRRERVFGAGAGGGNVGNGARRAVGTVRLVQADGVRVDDLGLIDVAGCQTGYGSGALGELEVRVPAGGTKPVRGNCDAVSDGIDCRVVEGLRGGIVRVEVDADVAA